MHSWTSWAFLIYLAAEIRPALVCESFLCKTSGWPSPASSVCSALEGKLCGELELPRVEHGARRAEVRTRCQPRRAPRTAGHLVVLDRERGSVFVMLRNGSAEVKPPIDREHFIHV